MGAAMVYMAPAARTLLWAGLGREDREGPRVARGCPQRAAPLTAWRPPRKPVRTLPLSAPQAVEPTRAPSDEDEPPAADTVSALKVILRRLDALSTDQTRTLL